VGAAADPGISVKISRPTPQQVVGGRNRVSKILWPRLRILTPMADPGLAPPLVRFDIAAKVPDSATKDQFQSMLRNLLATRFQMAIHWESKELPIYALLTAKNGVR
jgi:hypothetical protein